MREALGFRVVRQGDDRLAFEVGEAFVIRTAQSFPDNPFHDAGF